MNDKPLSKSAMEKYLNCSFGYDQHYNKRVRPIKIGSALVFGIGVDAALNTVLAKSKEDPLLAFRQATKQFALGRMTVGRYDYDRDLVTPENKKKALKYLKTLGYKGKNIDLLFNELIGKEKLSPAQEKAIDYIARLSFEGKCLILCEAYKKQVMPKLVKIHAIQKTSKAGVLDLKADWLKKGNTFIIDNKTAGQEYEENAADYSVQLVKYAVEEKIDNIMFIVLPKRVDKNFKKVCKKCGHKATSSHQTCNAMKGKKRCNGEWLVSMKPSVKIQIVQGKVTDRMKQATAQVQKAIEDGVKNKIFTCNFATCGNKFGKPCEYRDLFWKGSMDGLEKLPGGKK